MRRCTAAFDTVQSSATASKLGDSVQYGSKHPVSLARQKSALLHELVHHVQRSNNMEMPCVAAYEWQAYDLQIKWLREQGVEDPYALIGINELGIYMLSVCRDGS